MIANRLFSTLLCVIWSESIMKVVMNEQNLSSVKPNITILTNETISF